MDRSGAYDFVFYDMGLYRTISETSGDIFRKKNYFLPRVLYAPLKVLPSEFCNAKWIFFKQNMSLPCDENCNAMRIRLDTKLRRDEGTTGQTNRNIISLYADA